MEQMEYLLSSNEPWTRYRARIDLLDQSEEHPAVKNARSEMLSQSSVLSVLAAANQWGERVLKRHNDASHPIHALGVLADFGFRMDDEGVGGIVEKVLSYQSAEGAFQTLLFIPSAFGGTNEDTWTWVACDAPLLLHALISFGLCDDPRVQKALRHLNGLVEENGFRCCAAPELGRFRGPGRRDDPCPIANLYALKLFSLLPCEKDKPAAHKAAEMLLDHWADEWGKKYYLFGVGKTFRKIKYPFVWYDLLHALEVLSRFEHVRTDERFLGMARTLFAQADQDGRYTAGSIYQAWKNWSFANKKQPSPWLTFLVLRIQKRLGFFTPILPG